MTEKLLEISDLEASFNTYEGVARVLDGIDMSLDKGEAVALVGETGCGKSLTTKLIVDLVPPAITSGEIVFNGETVYSETTDTRESLRGDNISIIMQDPMSSLNPVFTVGEQMVDIAIYGKKGASLRKHLRGKLSRNNKERVEAREKARDVLEEVQISSPERVLSSYPNELSGGMRQRVLIGMALLSDPELLIADEPGTALDVTTEAIILDILKDIVKERETSIIYITHDLGVAYEVSDRVNVMYAGQMVEKSPTDEIFDSPKHPYTRTLLDSVPSLSGGIGQGAEGSIPSYVTVADKCRFADRCAFAEEVCTYVGPKQREISDDRCVSCHLYESQRRTLGDESESQPYIGPPPWETSAEVDTN